jgi:hypothetical protein
LTATSRPSRRSRARRTSDMAPRPTRSPTRYLPPNRSPDSIPMIPSLLPGVPSLSTGRQQRGTGTGQYRAQLRSAPNHLRSRTCRSC